MMHCMYHVQCHQQDSNSAHNIQASHFVAPSVSNPLIGAQPSPTTAPSLSAGGVSSYPVSQLNRLPQIHCHGHDTDPFAAE